MKQLRPGPLSAAAIACLAAGQFLTGNMTYVILRGFGHAPPWARVLRIHLLSQAAKYLPAGGLLNVGAQAIGLSRLPGTGLLSAGTAVGLMVVLVCSGAAATYGLSHIISTGSLSPWAAGALLILPVAAVFAARPLGWWARADALLARFGLRSAVGSIAWASSLRRAGVLTGLAFAAWLAFSGGAVALAGDMVALDFRLGAQIAGAAALSWLVGFSAIIAPAGLGVREVTLMLLLEPLLPQPWPAVYPVAARVSWVLADLVNLPIGWLAFRPRAIRPLASCSSVTHR